MTQTMDLNKMGLAPMSELEMKEIDGGNFFHWLLAASSVVAFIGCAIASAGLLGAGIIGISIGLGFGS